MKKILVGISFSLLFLSILTTGTIPGLSKKVSADFGLCGAACAFVSSTPPYGHLDGANCNNIGGWAGDADNVGIHLIVHIYDGTNTTPIGTMSTSEARKDVPDGPVVAYDIFASNYNIGFTILTPISVKDTSVHQIHAFAQNILSNGNFDVNPTTPTGYTELLTSPQNLGPCKQICGDGNSYDIALACPSVPSVTCPDGTVHPTGFICPANAPVGSVTGDCSTISGWAGDIDSVGTGLKVWASSTNFAPLTLTNFNSDSSPNLTPPAPGPYTGSHGFSMATVADWIDANSHTITIRYLGVNSAGTADNTNTNTTITIGPCKRAPALNVRISSCDSIVFDSADPDSPASQITFLVGRNPTVVLGGLNYVDTGVTINGTGTWTIPASEKNASSHSYYILVAGLDSSGIGDGVNTTSPVVNIQACAAPPPPTDVPGCKTSSANNFNPAATIDDGSCTYDPAVVVPLPPSETRPSTPFNDIFSSTCKNQDPANPTEVNATVCVVRTVSQTNDCNDIFGKCGIIAKLVTALSIIIGIASVVMVIVGGFKFVASAGDPQQAASARRIVLFASIGVVIAITAQGIILFVVNRL